MDDKQSKEEKLRFPCYCIFYIRSQLPHKTLCQKKGTSVYLNLSSLLDMESMWTFCHCKQYSNGHVCVTFGTLTFLDHLILIACTILEVALVRRLEFFSALSSIMLWLWKQAIIPIVFGFLPVYLGISKGTPRSLCTRQYSWSFGWGRETLCLILVSLLSLTITQTRRNGLAPLSLPYMTSIFLKK